LLIIFEDACLDNESIASLIKESFGFGSLDAFSFCRSEDGRCCTNCLGHVIHSAESVARSVRDSLNIIPPVSTSISR